MESKVLRLEQPLNLYKLVVRCWWCTVWWYSEPGSSHGSPYGEEDVAATNILRLLILAEILGFGFCAFKLCRELGKRSGTDVYRRICRQYEAPPKLTFNPSGDKAYHFVSEAMSWVRNSGIF